MSNNTAIEMLREEINKLEMKAKLEQDVSVRIKYLEEIVVASLIFRTSGASETIVTVSIVSIDR